MQRTANGKILLYSKLKLLLIMKFTAILIFVACLQVSARTYSQILTLKFHNVKLEQAFSEIEKQSGYSFIYGRKLVSTANPVSFELKDASLETALKTLFTNQPLSYKISEKYIIVSGKNVTDSALNVHQLAVVNPPITVQGFIKDAKGNAVTGAYVKIKGMETGAVTDDNGFYKLPNVNENAILVVSAVNIEPVEIRVNGKSVINVTATIKVSGLDEVQTIGYGTTTKRMNTGAVSTVKGAEIRDRPVANVIQALQGKMSGVSITTPVSGVGSPVQMLVRGTNSISSGVNPLIIIDGVIVNDIPGGLIISGITNATGGSNTYAVGNSPLNYINPNDIESVDVLKDADATAIYGSRGTNGVLLITTKKASLGKTRVQFNTSYGWKQSIGVTKRMNTEQYLQMRKDAFATGNMTATSVINPITPTNQNAPDLLVWNQSAYTDYPKYELNNAAPTYNGDINISGGTRALNYIAAGSYYKMYDTYMFNPYQERMTGRMQINSSSADNKLHLVLGSIFGIENQTFTTTNLGNILGTTNANAPNFELYKPDGSLNFGAGQGYITGAYYNPLPNKNITSKSKTDNLLLNGDISYSIIKDLVAKVQISYNSQSNGYHQLYPSTAVNVQNSITLPYGLHTTNKFNSVNIEPQLSYARQISKAKISALAGATFLDKKIEQTSVRVNNPGSDDLLYSFGSGNPTTATSNNTEEKFHSVFARLSADWDKKYIANFTFRRDGSSRFGPNNRYSNFGSAGLAWIFTNESFFKDHLAFLSFGKLRASYGTTGNNNIADYQYLSLLQAPTNAVYGRYNGTPGLNPANYANPDVKWETTTKQDIGIELGFLKNRILFNATWYRSLSTDLLVQLPLPTQTGFASYAGNFPGKVQNTGFEFDLTTHNLAPNNKVQWTTKFNITNNKNILKEFPGIESSVYALTYKVGRALPSTNTYNASMEMPFHFKQIDPATGLPQFADVNKDGIVNYNDAYTNASWIGSATPSLWGGLTNNISYKGFSLDIFLQFSNGIFSKWNFGGLSQNAIGSIYNPSADVAGNYWMQPGDVKKYPRLYTNVPGAAAYTNPLTQQYPFSDALLYKGYYIRLKNVQLSYSLPATLLSKIKFASALVYVGAENIAVYTPQKLYKDPETVLSRSAGLLRTLVTGIRIEF
jgi:TonB-linked SusC/RagA family outer membrane protein